MEATMRSFLHTVLLTLLVMSVFAVAADGLAATAKVESSDLDLAQMRADREMKSIEHRFRKEADARWDKMFDEDSPRGQGLAQISKKNRSAKASMRSLLFVD